MIDGRICPSCGATKTKVTNTKWEANTNRYVRYRKCKCGRIWKTVEIYVDAEPMLKRRIKEDI